MLAHTILQQNILYKYRVVTSFTIIYKLFKSILANKIYKHIVENIIIADEQQGYREQFVIDTILTRDAIKNKLNLVLAYIDYQKASDGVPHF